MKNSRILALFTAIGALAMTFFLDLFVVRNAPGLVRPGLVASIAVVYGGVCLAFMVRLVVILNKQGNDEFRRAGFSLRVFLILLLSLLVYLFLESTVTDYYQPLSLYDDAIMTLAIWWGTLIIVGLALVVSGKSGSVPAMRAIVVTTLCALACWPLAAVLERVNIPQANAQLALNQHVFIGGEDGYDTYRIPGMVVIPRGTELANGDRRAVDRLVAFAEARRDAALDDGVVDLVVKISDDGGINWRPQIVICRNLQQGRRGKCGNPTPVFDADSGMLILAYNMSGAEPDGPKHGGYVMRSRDGGQSWGNPRRITTDNFVFGPGKGLHKSAAPHTGRLILPGHLNDLAAVIFSDDGGASWLRGKGVDGGDESDVAELPDGRLYMATRHRAPISHAPEPNGRQFSLSSDGGASWSPASVDTSLPTPVCQATVLAYDGGLLFANPSHHRARVAMTLRYSPDAGANWPLLIPVYPGPAGYSVLASGSEGDVFLLYENGNMAYSDRISLARIPAGTLAQPENNDAEG